jgi:hypothetical protein
VPKAGFEPAFDSSVSVIISTTYTSPTPKKTVTRASLT